MAEQLSQTEIMQMQQNALKYKMLRAQIERVKPETIARKTGRGIGTVYKVYNKILKP